jgi:hypothetical protein
MSPKQLDGIVEQPFIADSSEDLPRRESSVVTRRERSRGERGSVVLTPPLGQHVDERSAIPWRCLLEQDSRRERRVDEGTARDAPRRARDLVGVEAVGLAQPANLIPHSVGCRVAASHQLLEDVCAQPSIGFVQIAGRFLEERDNWRAHVRDELRIVAPTRFHLSVHAGIGEDARQDVSDVSEDWRSREQFS